tara:strand:- start:629 stop:1204 length:576 start_codon:yes stop_codon:yes gene_type:complete
MGKKTIVQIALLFILLIIIFFFYYKYFFFKEEIVNLTYQNNEVVSSDNNLIKNLEYLSTDKNGNKYLINAEYGEVSFADAEKNIIIMTNVNAQIDLFEKDTVYLTSNFAKYNTLNLETNFYKNVVLQYTQHEISSDNIDLSFEKNFAWVYNNIVYNSSTNKFFADKLEIDLLTKDSKIYMYNNKKIKIIKK